MTKLKGLTNYKLKTSIDCNLGENEYGLMAKLYFPSMQKKNLREIKSY